MGARVDSARGRSVLRDTAGAAYVEYVTLLALVTVIGSVAVFSVGLPLLQTFRYAQAMIAMPFP